METPKIVIVVLAGIIAFTGSATLKATTVTDPTGLDGFVDPPESESINAEIGNYSVSQFNANNNRRVFQFEVSQGYPGNLAGSFGDIVLTKAVSGIDFSMHLEGVSGWYSRNYNVTNGYATSGESSIVFKGDTAGGSQILTFSTGVQAVGFVLSMSDEHQMTCKFYSDSSGNNLLQEYVVAPTAEQAADSGETPRAEMFVGYNTTSLPIERVDLYYENIGDANDAQWNMDDLVVVIPEPATIGLLSLGMFGLIRKR